MELNKPDIIVGSETRLTKEMFDSEFFPPELGLNLAYRGGSRMLTKDMFDSEVFPPELGFTVYRRDRIGQKGGRAIILVRSALSSERKSEFNSDFENLWVQLNLVGSRCLLQDQ